MRISIERRWRISNDFRIRVADSTIEVYQPKVLRPDTISERRWIWDGAEYSLAELPRAGTWDFRFTIYAGRQPAAFGCVIYPQFAFTVRRVAFGYIAWRFGEQRINEEPGYCGGTLRLADRQRLAVWRQSGRAVIACRNSMPRAMLPLIAGMVLARIDLD